MEQLIYTPFTETTAQKQKDIRQIVSNYTYHWPLFAISLFCTLMLAAIYLNQKKPVYHIKARIAIKDDKDKTATDKETALQQLNISTGPKLVESEVEILKSRPLISQVVDELQLWVTYTEPGFAATDLYATTPVHFKLLEPTGTMSDLSFDVNIKSMTHFTLTWPDGQVLEASFNDVIQNGFGKWQLKPTANIKSYLGKTITIGLKDKNKVVTDYQGKILTVLNKTAPIIELNIEDEVPKRGTQVLNRLISTYKEINIIDKNKETESTLKFIDERLASLSGELTDVEKNVEGYKSSIGLTDISSKSQFYLDNVQSNDGRLNEVNVQLNVINGIERYVNSVGKAESAPATIGITDPGLISLVGQLSKLQLERDKLLAITPENNPIFIPVNSQIKSVKGAIKENIGSIKNSLVATRKQLNYFNSGFEAGIKDIPGQERKYVSIKRQQGIKESLYIYLLQKREEVALSYASTLTDARTLEDAYYGKPQSNKKLPIAVAVLFGFLIPIGIISGRNSFKNRVLTRTDIEAVTSVPVICELIQETSKAAIVVLNRNAYAIGEQMRALRTSILHANNKKGKVILFTSSIAREGKSYVASNMGASMALLGKKTIILELDLRKPQISRIFNLDLSQPGLSDFLKGEASKDDIILPSGVHPNLFVMRSGPLPVNPSELLASRNMELLIDGLREEFDNILIDSPPLHLVTDAMILAPLCDVTLYLVRHNFTPKSELRFIEEVYREKKLTNMSLVFNGVQMDSRYGYSVDYGYYADKSAETGWHSIFGNFSSRF